MAFRFRRSIKLFPGVRLNVSTRGASVSVGGRGATVNLSGRGARATFGIPGTGLSWSESLTPRRSRARTRTTSTGPTFLIDTIEDLEDAVLDPSCSVVYRGSGRRLSPQQIESARSRLQAKKRREQASAQLVEAEGKQRDILNAWRNTADLPTTEDYENACAPRPFDFDEEPPAEPHYGTEEGKLHDEIRAEVRVSATRPATTYVVLAGLPMLGGAASFGASFLATHHAMGAVAVATVVAVVAVVATKTVLDKRWNETIEALLNQAFPARWTARSSDLAAQHRLRVAQFDQRRAATALQWNQEEERRAAWARCLVDGDTEALEDAVADTAGDLHFPFEAGCDVAISDDRTVFLHLDLPEIEDVIPETRGQVLKDGRVRQVKRTATERNADYANLVTGLGLFLANEVFVVSPMLHTVQIAAYTQRKKRGADAIVDAYVYDVCVKREYIAGLEFADLDSVSTLLTSSRAAVEQKANLELKALKRPAWTLELDSPPAA